CVCVTHQGGELQSATLRLRTAWTTRVVANACDETAPTTFETEGAAAAAPTSAHGKSATRSHNTREARGTSDRGRTPFNYLSPRPRRRATYGTPSLMQAQSSAVS